MADITLSLLPLLAGVDTPLPLWPDDPRYVSPYSSIIIDCGSGTTSVSAYMYRNGDWQEIQRIEPGVGHGMISKHRLPVQGRVDWTLWLFGYEGDPPDIYEAGA